VSKKTQHHWWFLGFDRSNEYSRFFGLGFVWTKNDDGQQVDLVLGPLSWAWERVAT
jgi:hypothetical protein